ncbi:MAG: hypothetical protein JWO95_2538, partial [Verrucomicrobiales bacterium]|nr:hypothetical protein [Verrucomicrobiales bacterium]
MLLACIALCAGCASPAQPKAMIAQKLPTIGVTHEPVVVVVTGGAKTNPMWMSKVSGEDFKTALLESLRKSKIFQSAQADGTAPFRLEVRLEVLEQPIFGFDLTVSMRADWTLIQSKDDRQIWHERVLSSHTATVGDEFVAVARLRVANEGAARKNIESALAKL